MLSGLDSGIVGLEVCEVSMLSLGLKICEMRMLSSLSPEFVISLAFELREDSILFGDCVCVVDTVLSGVGVEPTGFSFEVLPCKVYADDWLMRRSSVNIGAAVVWPPEIIIFPEDAGDWVVPDCDALGIMNSW